MKTILILEDNENRIAGFQRAVAALGDGYDLKIWRDADLTIPGPYVHHPDGLFPAPISAEDIANDGGL